MFDTMAQQLFNLARKPAIRDLLGGHPSDAIVSEQAAYATAIFMVGWALGGVLFGVLGDRLGRAKTMMMTILCYTVFTGLSLLSIGVWDFNVYRFLCGLGVGGQFAVGVALVAEVVPARARPYALGMVQACSAVGNMIAALAGIVLGQMEMAGAIGFHLGHSCVVLHEPKSNVNSMPIFSCSSVKPGIMPGIFKPFSSCTMPTA